MIPSIERVLIRRRLGRVARRLARREPAGLSEEQRLLRRRALDELELYRLNGELPRNTYVRGTTPVFEDGFGRRCAVAHLVAASGRTDLVVRTRDSQNLVRIHEMRDPELFAWADANGLTADELAEIQPGYSAGPDKGLQAIIAIAGLVGAAGSLLAVGGFLRRRLIGVLAVLGLTAVVGSALLATISVIQFEPEPCGGICFYHVVPRLAWPVIVFLWTSSILLTLVLVARRPAATAKTAGTPESEQGM